MKTPLAVLFSIFLLAKGFCQTGVVPDSFQQLFARTEPVETKFFPSDSNWITRPTFLFSNLKAYVPAEKQPSLDIYGGVIDKDKQHKTGFFYTKKLGDRWWIIDPEGNKWYCKAMVSVAPNNSQRGKIALKENFKDLNNWGIQTGSYLKSMGFNSAGAWSSIQDLALPSENKMVYSVVLDLMSSFGNHRGVASQGVGHMDYKNGIMPVFDPEFETFTEKTVLKKIANFKKDPWLLGYFSDNELNFKNDALVQFLKLPENDPNYQPVKQWAEANGVNISAVTNQDKQKFLEHYVDTYYRIVSSAIRKADPDHMFLTSRLHSPDKTRPVVFKVIGKYADIISYNYYKSWYPEKKITDMWTEQSGKPFMITEWYAKGMDSGMSNEGGWGWTVKTQEDRGKYYQNFALGLLATKNCVGWHWFKYLDNDPTAKSDPSNRDSNKGIVTWDYKPYQPLIDQMTILNHNVYSLIEFFDKKMP